jgi:hypothetical protein
MIPFSFSLAKQESLSFIRRQVLGCLSSLLGESQSRRQL